MMLTTTKKLEFKTDFQFSDTLVIENEGFIFRGSNKEHFENEFSNITTLTGMPASIEIKEQMRESLINFVYEKIIKATRETIGVLVHQYSNNLFGKGGYYSMKALRDICKHAGIVYDIDNGKNNPLGNIHINGEILDNLGSDNVKKNIEYIFEFALNSKLKYSDTWHLYLYARSPQLFIKGWTI